MIARRIDEVRPGPYRYRRVPRGPWLPAMVSVEDGMIFIVEAESNLRLGIAESSFADLVCNAVANGEASNSQLLRVLWWGVPIDQDEYDHLLRMLAWARAHQPDHPLCHPDEPIRLAAVPVASVF